jgi:hypothetical protein
LKGLRWRRAVHQRARSTAAAKFFTGDVLARQRIASGQDRAAPDTGGGAQTIDGAGAS